MALGKEARQEVLGPPWAVGPEAQPPVQGDPHRALLCPQSVAVLTVQGAVPPKAPPPLPEVVLDHPWEADRVHPLEVALVHRPAVDLDPELEVARGHRFGAAADLGRQLGVAVGLDHQLGATVDLGHLLAAAVDLGRQLRVAVGSLEGADPVPEVVQDPGRVVLRGHQLAVAGLILQPAVARFLLQARPALDPVHVPVQDQLPDLGQGHVQGLAHLLPEALGEDQHPLDVHDLGQDHWPDQGQVQGPSQDLGQGPGHGPGQVPLLLEHPLAVVS